MRYIKVVLRSDAPDWTLIDICHDLQLEFAEGTVYGEYVAAIYGEYVAFIATDKAEE